LIEEGHHAARQALADWHGQHIERLEPRLE